MNLELLDEHIHKYLSSVALDEASYAKDASERAERVAFYSFWTRARMLAMTEEDLYTYIAKLWAMRMWGNKQYKVAQLIEKNGFDLLIAELADLVWGDNPIPHRWDRFREIISGFGPAMMSEILCHVYPDNCMLWNRRAYVGLRYLGVENLPRYNYQMTGDRYCEVSLEAHQIAQELQKHGVKDANLLTADYFLWEELQVESNLTQIHSAQDATEIPPITPELVDEQTAEFIHDEIRDKVRDIGEWLGFTGTIEKKVSDGSKVDAIWESKVGNMGRTIYVFEVQTKGSVDSLIVNLLKSTKNPAVQAVVAVSDSKQLEKIRRDSADVPGLADKLKYWDYTSVLNVHESLESVNLAINGLGLVPEGF